MGTPLALAALSTPWAIALGVAIGIVATLAVGFLVQNAKIRRHPIRQQFDDAPDAGGDHFLHLMGTMFGPPLIEGNRITRLRNGDEIFPAMLDAVASAEHAITFETFIYWTGDIAERFAGALADRARAGVRVHVLLDDVGCKPMRRELIERMRDAGANIEFYNPPRLGSMSGLNHRTHRKILVVDGRVGFTGGVGIAAEWEGDARTPSEWRDTHFRVEGPVVAQLQAAFMDNWMSEHAEVLEDPRYFPELDRAGGHRAQVFRSSPRGGASSVRLMFQLAIASARQTIDLSTAYFVPDQNAVNALIMAVQRGVRVRVLLPGPHIDKRIVKWASRSRWGALLSHGVEIHRFAPTMLHTKALVVDGVWVTVGSPNFDARSFALNEEVALSVHDDGLARALTEDFEGDLERAERITLEQWRARPLTERVRERLAAGLAAQL